MLARGLVARLRTVAVPTAAVGFVAWSTSSLSSATEAEAAPAAGLDPTKWQELTLTKVVQLSHNSSVYRFAFDDPKATSCMGVASLLMTKAAIGSEKPDGTRANVMRPYTPISRPEAVGYVELAVKVRGRCAVGGGEGAYILPP